MKVPKLVVHTDVILDHLTGNTSPSVLRLAMGMYLCYTTVFHAIELFSFARTEKEAQAVEDAMAGMKVLGLNPKNARRYGELRSTRRNMDSWNLLIAGLCVESKLPILTDRKKHFAGVPGLVLIPTKAIRNS